MRLALDFHKNSSAERIDFLNNYIENNKGSFTEDNLEMMANYILWAVEKENNESFQIESKNSPWTKKHNDISFEGLLEQESETGLPAESLIATHATGSAAKAKLNREEVIQKLTNGFPSQQNNKIAQAFLKEKDAKSDSEVAQLRGENNIFIPLEWHPLAQIWFDLWSSIDQTEYIIQTWEIKHGKRRADLPIRQELLDRLVYMLIYKNRKICLSTLRAELDNEADKWDGYFYLKKKRSLVQLRTQQYSLLDCTSQEPMQKHMNTGRYYLEETAGINEFFPFMSERLLIQDITEDFFKQDFQQLCVKSLRHSDKALNAQYLQSNKAIDLRDPNTIRHLLFFRADIKNHLEDNHVSDREINELLLKYIQYYINKCNFSDDLNYILECKVKKMTNKEIADSLKDKFGIIYKDNYISTIFTKRIVEAIVEQVNLHYKMIEYITMGKNVFKKCSVCGKLLPRNSTYFNKRTSTSDGFFSYCKDCKTRKK